MKNKIAIRLENTMFRTTKVQKHLPKAKDRAKYLLEALPKCAMSGMAVRELTDFLKVMRGQGRPVELTVLTDFRGEAPRRLLALRDLAWARVAGAAARLAPDTEILISDDPADLEAAATLEIETACPAGSGSLLTAIGVRKAGRRDFGAA